MVIECTKHLHDNPCNRLSEDIEATIQRNKSFISHKIQNKPSQKQIHERKSSKT